jgi:CheY-like chemotaxis protein
MHFANSGEDALDQLAGGVESTLIAILSDINMPGMDGLQLLGKIKERFPELPVMMVTAHNDDEPAAAPMSSAPPSSSPSRSISIG